MGISRNDGLLFLAGSDALRHHIISCVSGDFDCALTNKHALKITTMMATAQKEYV
jgi:hypothetical protein